MEYLDPENPNLAYTEKRIQIKGTTMAVESEVNPTTGKKYKPNADFLVRLGVLIRHIKLNCVNRNSIFELNTGVFDANISNTYEVDVQGHVASITLTYSSISKFSFEGFGFEIYLNDEQTTGFGRNDTYYTTTENVTIKFKKSFLYDFFGIEDKKKDIDLDFSNINEGESAFYSTIDEIIEAHPDKDFSWLFERDYRIVTDETLEETIEYLKQFKVISMDTETTGLKITFKSRIGEHDECVGIIITGKEKESFYFPMKHTKFDNLCGGDDWYFMETYMKPLLEQKDVVVHNATFDWKVIFIYGIATNIIFDTMVAFALTMTAKYGTPYGLKDLTALILKRDSLELDDLCKNGDFSSIDETFADLPMELVRLYACPDADNTLALFNYILNTKMLEEYNAVKVTQFESIFACAISYSEFHGQFIDVNKTDQLVEEITRNQEQAFEDMVKILKEVGYDTSDFNPNSNQQKLNIVYDVLGCPEQINLKNKRTADKKALKKLAEMTDGNDEPLYPFVIALQRYNEAETIRKNFTKNLPTLFTQDGFSFSGVDQFKTTGRVSTKNPNYQGYDDTVKRYIEPRPGFYMADSDYASIEYRVIASMSGQEWLMEAFIDPNTDYHKLQASNMFDVPYELVTSAKRREAKAFNFGLPFGMGDEKLGFTLFGEVSASNTRKATEYRRKYFNGQEKVQKFFVDAQNDAVKNGYTETYFHRRRYYNKETTSVGSIKRQGGNQRIQGTAADIYKQGVVRLFLRIINEGWLDKVLLTAFVHDELVSEVSNEIHPLDWMKVLKEETELDIEGFCPIYIGMGIGRTWYEAKKVEIPTELQSQLQGNIEEFPNWHGNIEEFAKWVPRRIDQFEMEYVDAYITNQENRDKVIPSVVYDYLTNQVTRLQDEILEELFTKASDSGYLELNKDVLSVFVERTKKLVSKIQSHKPTLEERINLYCEKNKINLGNCNVAILCDESDLIDYSNLQSLLDFYCNIRGIDRKLVSLISPSDVKEVVTSDNRVTGEQPKYDSYYEQGTDEEKAKKLFITKLQEYGSHLNVDERIAYFKYDSKVMNVLQKYVNKEEKGYGVAFYDLGQDKRFLTKSYIESSKLSLAQRELMLLGV